MGQDRLEELLKKKGIGPQGSKSLSPEEVELVKNLFQNNEVSLTTKATMLTALFTLESNSDEALLVEEIRKNPEQTLPNELLHFVQNSDSKPFQNLINKTIRKESLNFEEASRAMNFFFDKNEPDYLKAAFLEAQRLKRETFTENQAFFASLWDKSERKEISTTPIIHLCDSFDGSNRTRNYAIFVAALLATAGYYCVLSGTDSVAPKNGITAHSILKAANKNPLTSLNESSEELQNIGWTYIDQSIFSPELYALKQMRKEMVKRPFLATFEKLLQPIRSTGENYIVTGYTHPHYREELVKQLKEQGKCSKAIILKGMEGNTHLSLTKESVCVQLDGNIISDSLVEPKSYGLTAIEEKQDKTISAEVNYEEGLAALQGEKNYARESIIYLSAVILDKFALQPSANLNEKLSALIENGSAYKKFMEKA